MFDPELESILRTKQGPCDSIENFLINLAVCHTIVTSKDPKDESKNILNSSSPDELALINGAKYYGIEFEERTGDGAIIVKQNGIVKKYRLLNVIEFTSERKRMTVVVRTPENKIKVICKGADAVLAPLLAENQRNSNILPKTIDHLYDYATIGLRTLMICEKQIEERVYREWHKAYESAKVAINNREIKVKNAVAQIENEFELVGATAIEDQLQEEVGETISAVKEAGVKFWMLTGDKLETAINIGYSCQVLDQHMVLFKVEQKSK
jgi:magnesium-transporting ATPase (P-type)